jgi:hypothetical protein
VIAFDTVREIGRLAELVALEVPVLSEGLRLAAVEGDLRERCRTRPHDRRLGPAPENAGTVVDSAKRFDKIPRRIWTQHGGHTCSCYLADEDQFSEVLLTHSKKEDLRHLRHLRIDQSA